MVALNTHPRFSKFCILAPPLNVYSAIVLSGSNEQLYALRIENGEGKEAIEHRGSTGPAEHLLQQPPAQYDRR